MKVNVIYEDEIRPIEDSPHVQILNLHKKSESEIEFEMVINGLDIGENLMFVVDD